MGKLPVLQRAKWCANCVYWGGERTINGFFGRAKVDINCQANGVCSNIKGFLTRKCLGKQLVGILKNTLQLRDKFCLNP